MRPYNKKEILESLEPFFRLGYSRYKACKLIGFDEGLLNKWEKADSTISVKINSWIADANIKARKVWVSEIENGNYQASKEWLERKEKDEFSLKQEITQESLNLNPIIEDNESKRIIDKYLNQQRFEKISS